MKKRQLATYFLSNLRSAFSSHIWLSKRLSFGKSRFSTSLNNLQKPCLIPHDFNIQSKPIHLNNLPSKGICWVDLFTLFPRFDPVTQWIDPMTHWVVTPLTGRCLTLRFPLLNTWRRGRFAGASSVSACIFPSSLVIANGVSLFQSVDHSSFWLAAENLYFL